MRPSLVLVLVLLATVATANAAPPAAAPPSADLFHHLRPRAWQPPARALAPAVRVAIDPETGALTSLPVGPLDASELNAVRANEAALARLQPVVRADGSRFLRLDGLLRAYTVVRVGPDGRLVSDCAESPAEVLRLMHAPLPAPPVGEDR